MAIRRIFISLALASIFVIAFWLPGFIPQVMAETLNFRTFTHAEKAEVFPIPDAEGHIVRFTLREGVYIFENGDLAWCKQSIYNDLIKEVGILDIYTILTFLDGCTITTHVQTKTQATSAGVQTGSKSTGEIIHGMGRFQGMKGTVSSSAKTFPPEKGEPAGKSVGQGTYTYTLPSK